MSNQSPANQLMDIAMRIRDMREILGYSMEKMADLTEISVDTYRLYETGTVDLRWMGEYTSFGTIEHRYNEEP